MNAPTRKHRRHPLTHRADGRDPGCRTHQHRRDQYRRRNIAKEGRPFFFHIQLLWLRPASILI